MVKLPFLQKTNSNTSVHVEMSSNVLSCHRFSFLSSESLPAAEEEYAMVRPQTKRKKRKVEKEEEVQYGEVTFTPKPAVAPQQPQEECVYSQVQRR